MRPFFGRSKMSRVLSARARARARARPSCSTGASGPFDDRRLRSTTFRARATLVLLLYRTFFGALIVLLRLEANLSGSTLTCRFTFICRFWVLLKVCRLIPSRTKLHKRLYTICASHAGRVHDFFLRKARRNSGDLPKLA